MGIVWSWLGWEAEDPADNEPDPATGLTPREKRALRESWAPLRKNMKPVGLAFFVLFFRSYPEFRNLFPALKDLSSEELKMSKRLQAHGTSFMLSVTNIVEHLDEPEVIVVLCEKLGQSHRRFELQEKDFKAVVALFLQFFSDNYPDGVPFPKEFVCEAWKKAFDVVVKLICDSM